MCIFKGCPVTAAEFRCASFHLTIVFCGKICLDLDVVEKDAVALFDFKARNEKELTLRKGDALQLHARVSSEWWRGSCGGHIGFIPHNYIAIQMRFSMWCCCFLLLLLITYKLCVMISYGRHMLAIRVSDCVFV